MHHQPNYTKVAVVSRSEEFHFVAHLSHSFSKFCVRDLFHILFSMTIPIDMGMFIEPILSLSNWQYYLMNFVGDFSQLLPPPKIILHNYIPY